MTTEAPEPADTLSELDRGIISILKESGRASANEIARTLHADYRLVRNHLSDLLDSGTVKVNALADPSLLGDTTVAFLWVTSWSTENDLGARLAAYPEVMWASLTTTGTRTVAQLSCSSAGELLSITDDVRSWPTVETVTSEIVLRSYVGALNTSDSTPEPVSPPWLGSSSQNASPQLDDLDHRILNLLRDDGRTALTAIAEQTGVPLTTVRRRVNRLLGSEGVRMQCRVDPAALGYARIVGVTIQVIEDAAGLATDLSELPSAMWVSEVTGAYPLTVELMGTEQADIDLALTEIRADARIRHMHVDYYAETVKATGRW